MTSEFYRNEAQRCRRIAAEWPGTESANHFIALADNHDRAADILIELNKINARLPRGARILNRLRVTRH